MDHRRNGFIRWLRELFAHGANEVVFWIIGIVFIAGFLAVMKDIAPRAGNQLISKPASPEAPPASGLVLSFVDSADAVPAVGVVINGSERLLDPEGRVKMIPTPMCEIKCFSRIDGRAIPISYGRLATPTRVLKLDTRGVKSIAIRCETELR